MIRQEALTLMSGSMTVAQWNDNRETVKNSCTEEEWSKIYPHIDTEGLIVKTLKANRRKARLQK